ncbi:MAG: dethiobiotin synthase [Pseudomonadota bacterium]
MSNLSSGFIITGTDTGIGKTVFAAGLTAALKATYWKPIQAGIDGETDTQVVQRLASMTSDRIISEAYRLRTPCSPHLAAKNDGVKINVSKLAPPTTRDPLIIEGAGGLLVPLTQDVLQIETFKQFNRPIILCARTTLGTINHTLLSLEAIRARALPLAGIAFIGDANDDSERTICGLGKTQHLGRLPTLEPLNSTTLQHAFSTNFPTLVATREAV